MHWLHVTWSTWPPQSKTREMKNEQDSLKTLNQLASFCSERMCCDIYIGYSAEILRLALSIV